ncbi:MAG: alpha/beta fold hydrolase [Deltaproteobacteria bacterium]|nr:alpha/beta fold hydrolase [Deltaproteobacteria bacterium]
MIREAAAECKSFLNPPPKPATHCGVSLLCPVIATISAAAVLINTLAYAQRWRVKCAAGSNGEERIGLINAVLAFAAECAALALLLATLPLGWWRSRHQTPPPAGNRSTIILIHGWGLNAASCWWLRRRLQQHGGHAVYCFAYSSWRVDVEAAAAQLHQLLAQMRAQPGDSCTLIGHSLGGLVARYCLRRYPARGVRRLITLGTPHGGTLAAPAWAPFVSRLRPEAAFMRRLNAGDRVPEQFEVIAIHSRFDAHILPPENAEYPGACNIEVAGVGHNALLFSRRAATLIAENLGPPCQGAYGQDARQRDTDRPG